LADIKGETSKTYQIVTTKYLEITKSLALRGFLREEEKKEKRRKIGFLIPLLLPLHLIS